MKIFTKKFVLVMLILMSSSAAAQWAVEGVYVKSVEQFYIGNVVVTRAIYETDADSQLPGFVCVPNTTSLPGETNRYQASYWNSGTNAYHQLMLSQLLSAQAQGLKIDIFFDPSGCDQGLAYGYYGVGRRMTGIRVNVD